MHRLANVCRDSFLSRPAIPHRLYARLRDLKVGRDDRAFYPHVVRASGFSVSRYHLPMDILAIHAPKSHRDCRFLDLEGTVLLGKS